jgi:hypothetical protein
VKTPIMIAIGLIFAGPVSSAFASVPLTEKIGTVPLDIFRAMSGNFSQANGYTDDLTLLAPGASFSSRSISTVTSNAPLSPDPSVLIERSRAAVDRRAKAREFAAAHPDDRDAQIELLQAQLAVLRNSPPSLERLRSERDNALAQKKVLDDQHSKTLFEPLSLPSRQSLQLTPSPTSNPQPDAPAPVR